MKKLFGAALALALTVTLLTGCRGNVSSHENGRITDPTMMPETIATMPSTDTTPVTTTPPTVTTQPTQETGDSILPSMDNGSENNGNNAGSGSSGSNSENGTGGGAGGGNGTGSSGSSTGTAGTGTKARPNRNMG